MPLLCETACYLAFLTACFYFVFLIILSLFAIYLFYNKIKLDLLSGNRLIYRKIFLIFETEDKTVIRGKIYDRKICNFFVKS